MLPIVPLAICGSLWVVSLLRVVHALDDAS